MLTLLQLSDLHFGPPYLPDVGEAVLREAERLQPDIIVVSGDFTQRAKKAQFSAASDFLGRLPRLPVVVVPGNHDVPLYRVIERLTQPYALYKRYITPELDAVYRRDDCVIVSLNTTSPLESITSGRIKRWQLKYCTEAFQGAPDSAVRIIVAHHPLAPPADYDNDFDVIPRAREALDHFNSLGVELILSGHLHRAYIAHSLDIYPGKDRSAGIVLAQSGTSTSRRGRGREREKNTYNVLEIDDREIRVAHWMFFHEAGGFQPISLHHFPRRRCRSLNPDDTPPVT